MAPAPFRDRGGVGVTLRRGSAETKTTRATRHNSNLTLEGEEGREVMKLSFGHFGSY